MIVKFEISIWNICVWRKWELKFRNPYWHSFHCSYSIVHCQLSWEKGEKLTNGRIQTKKPKPAFICNNDKRNMITYGWNLKQPGLKSHPLILTPGWNILQDMKFVCCSCPSYFWTLVWLHILPMLRSGENSKRKIWMNAKRSWQQDIHVVSEIWKSRLRIFSYWKRMRLLWWIIIEVSFSIRSNDDGRNDIQEYITGLFEILSSWVHKAHGQAGSIESPNDQGLHLDKQHRRTFTIEIP